VLQSRALYSHSVMTAMSGMERKCEDNSRFSDKQVRACYLFTYNEYNHVNAPKAQTKIG